jgi:hypothetical protein
MRAAETNGAGRWQPSEPPWPQGATLTAQQSDSSLPAEPPWPGDGGTPLEPRDYIYDGPSQPADTTGRVLLRSQSYHGPDGSGGQSLWRWSEEAAPGYPNTVLRVAHRKRGAVHACRRDFEPWLLEPGPAAAADAG